MLAPYGQTWTVLRGGRDRFGDPVTGAEHDETSCVYAPRGTPVETTAGRDTVTTVDALYMRFEADVKATDQLRDPDGVVWDIDGTPTRWQSPHTGRKAGTVVILKRVTG